MALASQPGSLAQRMFRSRRVLALAVSCLLAANGVAGAAASKAHRDSTGDDFVRALWANPSSGWTRTDEVVNGTYIYTDPVFDDKGANVDSTTGGDAAYPHDGTPYMRNAADIV